MTEFVYPWASDLSTARSVIDLNGVWEKWASPGGIAVATEQFERAGFAIDPTGIRSALGTDLNEAKARLQEPVDDSPAPNPGRKESAAETLENDLYESAAAVDTFALVVEEEARAGARYKHARAKKMLWFKTHMLNGDPVPEGKRVTDGEATLLADADDEVAALNLTAVIAEAQLKAARARLEHIERKFERSRSVFSHESRIDARLGGR